MDELLNSRQGNIGIFVVLFSSILIALAPNAAKIAYQNGATPIAVIMTRQLTGVVLVAAYLTVRGLWPKRGLSVFRRSAFAGLAQLVMAFGFFGSVAYIDVSLAVLIIYFHTFLIALIGWSRGGERITRLQMICIFTAIVGLGFVLSVSLESIDPLGIGLSVIGMLAVTAWILLGASISRESEPFVANFYMTSWSIIFLSIVVILVPNSGFLMQIQYPNTIVGWVAILGAGVTNTVGFVLFFIGAIKIGTTRATLLTLSEPVFAILLAIFMVQESLSYLQWAGVLIVVVCLVRFEIGVHE